MTFQSTLPTRGSDMPLQDKAKNDIVFQSTLPTRGSDGRRAMEKILRSEISIHAPHEGERPQAGDMRPRRKNISIHAPHEVLYALKDFLIKRLGSLLEHIT